MTEFRQRLAEACKRYADDPENDDAARELARVFLDCPLDDPAFDFEWKIAGTPIVHWNMAQVAK